MRTETIRYNLKDRCRQHTGQPRNFDIPAIVANINSPRIQERVKKRDMLGYYGHWPRQRLGLIPPEGAVLDGKVVHIEPAFVTVSLKASMDGTIEHEAEFFDNTPGRVAAGLWKNRAGGFSSAIHEPTEMFYGFDYVKEPNYSSNRPYTLDTASVAPLTLDDVNHYQATELAEGVSMLALLDSVNAESEALRAQLAGKSKEMDALREQLRIAKLTFDASSFGKPGATHRLFREAKETLNAKRHRAAVTVEPGSDASFDAMQNYVKRFHR